VNVIDKERQALDPALKALLDETPEADKNFIYCAQCSHVLGRASDAIDISGSHHHFCTNPHGIDFNVCCYKNAPGATISGPPTRADSWFVGHTWRFATCSGCNVHLGWLFETVDDEANGQFYGLVAERFQTDSQPNT